VALDGKNLVSHAGTAPLGELADRSSLTEATSLSMRECGINRLLLDPGVVPITSEWPTPTRGTAWPTGPR
jgi:hypothetical protein